jgi:methyl-accepting chemotaxis protein
MNLSLGNKILAAALAAVTVTAAISLLVQRDVIRKHEIALAHETMRMVIDQGEATRAHAAALFASHAYDEEKLRADLRAQGDLRKSLLYQTIPIVAAWTSIENSAKSNGFDFRVARAQPRDPAHTPTAEEAEILRALGDKADAEFFKVDAERGEIVYARPVVVSSDCLACHGDPKNSPTHDGKDLTGTTMEGWKTSETQGAFILRKKSSTVHLAVRAGLLQALCFLVPTTLLVGLGFHFLNRRGLILPLQNALTQIEKTVGETAAAAQEITHSSQTLAQGAAELASSLEETSAALEEMSSMTARNAQSASTGKQLSAQARGAASEGVEHIHEMGATLSGIQGAVEGMKGAVGEMQSSSREVGQIIKTIDEIAFQTNLLALNAAVEAARAGEAGMGFAVVADEVRVLAQRCAQAAKDTSEKIQTSIRRCEEGAQASKVVVTKLLAVEQTAEKVQLGFQAIATKITSLDEVIAEIATASEEQKRGVAEVASAVSDMDRVSQGAAASAEENAAAAEELNAQSSALGAIVREVYVVIEGGLAASAPGSRPAPPSTSSQRKAHPPIATPSARAITSAQASIPLPPPPFSRRGVTPAASDFEEF